MVKDDVKCGHTEIAQNFNFIFLHSSYVLVNPLNFVDIKIRNLKVFIFDISFYRFVLKYFQSAPAPFHEQEGNSCEPKQKKLKNGHELQRHCVADVNIAKATYILLQHVGEDLTYLWKWSDILPFLNHSSEEVRWLVESFLYGFRIVIIVVCITLSICIC